MKVYCLIALALLFGCSESERRAAPTESNPATGAPASSVVESTAAKPFIVVDDAGRELRFSVPPRRVLSLAPSNTELVFAIDGGHLLVGRTSQCDHPTQVSEISSVGSLFPPDYEKIVAARPDVVLMTDGSEEVRGRLTAQGLTVVVIQPKGVAQVADSLRLLGRVIGQEQAAERVAKTYELALAAETVTGTKQTLRVFYEVWSAPLTAAGPTSFVGDLIKAAGGVNVVTSAAPWPRPPAEQIVSADPEIIIVARAVDRGALLEGKRAGWGEVTAVKRGKVFVPPDPSLLVRPGPRLIEGLRWLKAKFAESRQ